MVMRTTALDEAEVKAAVLSGEAITSIALRLGCSRGAVAGLVWRRGWKAESGTRPPRAPRQAPPRPEPVPTRRQEAPAKVGTGVLIYEVPTGGCKYPTGAIGRTHLFCAERAEEGGVYCPEHAALCYRRDL